MPLTPKDANSRAVPEPQLEMPVVEVHPAASAPRDDVRERGQIAQPLQSAQRATVPFARVALAIVELSLAAASVCLAVRLLGLPDSTREGFLSHNTLPAAQRASMFLALVGAAGLPMLIGAVVYLRGQIHGLRLLLRAGEVFAPLALSCFVPALLDPDAWYDKPLPFLVQVLVFGLVLERLLRRAFTPPTAAIGGYVPVTTGVSTRLSRALPLAIVLVFAVGYGVYMSYYTIMRHRLLGTAGFDLGIFDNLMFNAMHGRPFRSTVAVPNGSYLSNHAEYGMYLFIPFYALHPNAETLLVLQSVFIGLAAWPLYLFCATQITRPAAAALACAYLFYAPLHGPNFYDFHWMPMAVFFFHWLFYALAKRHVPWVIVLTAIVCSMREDTALGVIMIGLFLVITRYWVRMGAWLAGVSMCWFMLVKFVIMPWAGPWWFADIYKDLIATGEHGYGSIVRTILINPNYFLKTLLTETKLVYALHLFAPLLLLPLRYPALALLMLPGFFVSLMTTGYGPTVSITFQYTTTWIPFLFGATAIALRERAKQLGSAARKAGVAALCVGVLLHSYVFGAILQHDTFTGGFSRVFFDMSPGEKKRYEDLREIASLIPRKASVAAGELEIPHVSARLNAYTLKIMSGDADYLLLNRQHVDSEVRQRLKSSLREFQYGLVKKKGLFFLFAKNYKAPPADTDAALKALGLSSGARVQP